MATYTINGKRITTDTPLTEAQIDEIASEMDMVSNAVARQEQPVLDKFTQSNLPQEVAQDLSSWWEARTIPNVPEPFDLATSAKRVGASTALMAGIGSVVPGVGTLAGAASGALGGVAGEVGRNLGMSDVATFGLEMLGGEAPQVVEAGAKGLAKLVSPADYRAGRTLGIFANDRLRQESVDQVKKNYFGKPAFDVDFVPQYTDEFQTVTKESLGIPSTNPNSVSSILRQKYYADVENLGQGGAKGFITSPEHTELISKLNLLAKSNRLEKGEKTALNNILKLEVDKDPEARKLFAEELTNYIQNGGAFEVSRIDGKPQIAQKINANVQEVLRETFDKYLERNLGSKRFGELKAIERKEFEAKARDLIPTIISSKGTLPKEDLDFILGNVKNSPVVKKEFSQALLQRLSDPKLDSSDKLLREFRKYNKDLVSIGVFDRKGLSDFYSQINKFDKTVDKKAIKNLITSTLAIPITTAEAVEGSAQVFRPPMQPPPSPIPAFGM